MDYSWSDSSALYQLRYYREDEEKGKSAQAYLEYRLKGDNMSDANLMINSEEKKEETEPTVTVDGADYYVLGNGDVICPECGRTRSTSRISDHMASEHSAD